jgi:hypothetical protein
LHRRCTAAAPLLHRCCTDVAPLLHRCCTVTRGASRAAAPPQEGLPGLPTWSRGYIFATPKLCVCRCVGVSVCGMQEGLLPDAFLAHLEALAQA